jgi:hypothetical protein
MNEVIQSNCIYCKCVVIPERVKLGYKYCVVCAESKRPQTTRKGVMIYGHKTAGAIQIMSEQNFNDYRRLNPYGKNTGRGSGLHKVSKATSCI